MDISNKLVSAIPVEKIWNNIDMLDSAKLSYLTREEIGLLLSETKVSFIVANIGDQLRWIAPDQCFTFWKSEVQQHIADKTDQIYLETFPQAYAYLASRWTSDGYPIILLEKLH